MKPEVQEVLCRVCGVPIASRTESKIGVHISCVQETRLRKVHRIPRPLYGSQRAPEAQDG